ncbi:sulfurtransferase [Sporosarcina highlanderae]|uniref:Sulfurtransferase n=1 Tax=Sporosarcina highlanderae TaxID=3035916 RepID=A0ABT8JU44_9BACL|nr:sulfurtransferase [Sporosarcina highlanderae]MDN4608696.1 sulfurtransferase [Sporosarcina highlanderae]
MGEVFKSINEVNVERVKWIDARFSLQDANLGRKKFEEGHIKGAVHWDLGKDLSDLKSKSGRHPLPDKEELTSLFRESGLELEDLILVYDDGGAPFATRAWWILQYAGFKNSFIAIEGFDQLKTLGVAVSDEFTKPLPSKVVPKWNESIFASRQFVEKTVAGETGNVLVDARSAERYRGEVEPIDPIAGHIPGALNFDWEQLKKDGAYDLGSDVKDQLSKVVNQEDEITVYCGSGVTATPLYAMLKHNGYDHVKLYVGSYSDWISRDSIEVEKG